MAGILGTLVLDTAWRLTITARAAFGRDACEQYVQNLELSTYYDVPLVYQRMVSHLRPLIIIQLFLYIYIFNVYIEDQS